LKLNSYKAVVTGGAGFIGSHIAEELANNGCHVIILDNLSTGKVENIQHLLSSRQADFIHGSILDLPLLQIVFKGVDYVFHEGAIASVPKSIEDPAGSHETNVTGTFNVLLAARENNVKKVVFASSSAVYGDTPFLYKKEDMIPEPQSIYAVNKLAGEHYCSVFKRVYDLPTVCLRYFNVFGPRQNPNSEYAALIPKFIQNIREGKELQIYGDGEQSRDFVYVKDIVAANLLLAKNGATGVFNIGTGEKVTINRLVDIFRTLLNKGDIQPIYIEERPGDIKYSMADISKAREIGYSPQYTLTAGLSKMLGVKELQKSCKN
jgi:UDP-glucose 4-epimerase